MWTNCSAPQAFIVFNARQLGLDSDPMYAPHSGEQMLISFSSAAAHSTTINHLARASATRGQIPIWQHGAQDGNGSGSSPPTTSSAKAPTRLSRSRKFRAKSAASGQNSRSMFLPEPSISLSAAPLPTSGVSVSTTSRISRLPPKVLSCRATTFSATVRHSMRLPRLRRPSVRAESASRRATASVLSVCSTKANPLPRMNRPQANSASTVSAPTLSPSGLSALKS